MTGGTCVFRAAARPASKGQPKVTRAGACPLLGLHRVQGPTVLCPRPTAPVVAGRSSRLCRHAWPVWPSSRSQWTGAWRVRQAAAARTFLSSLFPNGSSQVPDTGTGSTRATLWLGRLCGCSSCCRWLSGALAQHLGGTGAVSCHPWMPLAMLTGQASRAPPWGFAAGTLPTVAPTALVVLVAYDVWVMMPTG